MINHSFIGTTKLPEDWDMITSNYEFDEAGLSIDGSSMVCVPLGNEIVLESLRVEIELTINSPDDLTIEFEVGSLSFILRVLSKEQTTHRISRLRTMLIAKEKALTNAVSNRVRLSFEIDGGKLSAAIDGQKVISGRDPLPQPIFGKLNISFHHKTVVRSIKVYGEKATAIPEYLSVNRKTESLDLEVTIDFYDDLLSTGVQFTQNMFDHLFKELKSWGTRRVKFIDHGGKKYGWWDHPHGDNLKIGLKTFINVGDILPAAVKAAHAHDMEIYALFKPFDMAIQYTYGEGTKEYLENGKLSRVGGSLGWCTDFLANHPEFLMARKPGAYGKAENELIHRIDLVKEDDLPSGLSSNNIKLYVSDDNAKYHLYNGQVDIEDLVEDYPVWPHTPSGGESTGAVKRSRIVRLKGLNITNKYFVIIIENSTGSFANSLINLIHVFGEKGEERCLTYGSCPRQIGVRKVGDFRDTGVEFDKYHSSPTNFNPGWDGMEERFDLTQGTTDQRFLAVAMGKDKGAITLSPSFPQVREYWLSWVRDAIEAGTDGVDLRLVNHGWHFTWHEFGFEKPVVDTFKEQYGIDILSTDDFDRTAFRKIRGEAYTRFCREAKALLSANGKKLIFHINRNLETPPDLGGGMEIYWDWQTWFKEELCDGVTLKMLRPDSRFGREVIFLAKKQKISVVYSPYCNVAANSCNLVMSMVPACVKIAGESGCDGFNFYESAAIVRISSNGEVIMLYPELKKFFQKKFC